MEKKTIGKFIAVLRKANGMTQKELGDRLYVSDKTVSRWERDECTPELALIPVIAEIFGITTDELLRGERNTAAGEGATPETAETVAYQKKKSDKQWKALLHRRMTTYQNLTALSVGLSVVGLLGAALGNLALTRGLVGFCIAAVFLLASVICELCFAANAKMPIDEDEDADASRTATLVAFNDRVAITAVRVLFADFLLLAFCMPVMRYSHMGLKFGAWLGEGMVFVLVALVIGWSLYTFAIRPTLIKRGILSPDSEDTVIRRRAWHKILRKHVVTGGVIAVVLCVLAAVTVELPPTFFVEPTVFEDKESFQAFMLKEAERTREEVTEEVIYRDENGYSVNVDVNMDTEVIFDGEKPPKDTFDDSEKIDYHHCYDLHGQKILFSYAYCQDYRIDFDVNNENRMPVKVYENAELHTVTRVLDAVGGILLALVAADAVVITVLLIKQRKKLYRA